MIHPQHQADSVAEAEGRRTKCDIFDIDDAMQQAVTTSTPFHTRLDTPPSALRVAHPSRH